MSVVPAWPTFWTIMSTLMPAAASGSKIARAMPGRSGTADERDLGDLPVEGEPADLVAQLHVGSSLMRVPGASLNEVERTRDDHAVDPAELDGPGLHHLGALVGELEHLLVADDRQMSRASGTRRGSAVKMPSTSV